MVPITNNRLAPKTNYIPPSEENNTPSIPLTPKTAAAVVLEEPLDLTEQKPPEHPAPAGTEKRE